MHTKKLFCIGFIALLVLSIATVAMGDPWDSVVDNPQPANACWVDPLSTTGLSLDDVFVVDVLINMTDMYGYEYKLFWNSTVLELLSNQTHNPGAYTLVKDIQGTANATWPIPGYDGLAFKWQSYTKLGPVAGFTGVTSLCTFKFKVKYQPYFPESDYVGTLDLVDDKFKDSKAGTIVHTTNDGSYTIPAVVPPLPQLEVVPDYVTGELGVNFTLNIEIKQLAAAYDLAGWEVKLRYNTSVLDCLDSKEGSFLPGFEGPNGTYYINVINDTLGIVHTAGLFLGAHTKPFGSGVLAQLIFNATYEYEVPTEGAPPFVFDMDLYDTKLVDTSQNPINHTVKDGKYEAPYRTLGWSLDCYTDKYRKPWYETPFTGEGINATADAYEPQELVILYAKLTYNDEPEQNKDVMFEIYGPTNPYDNITIFRVARTNASGIATINFTIPWPSQHAEEIVIGKWVCYQKAQVKDPWRPGYYATPDDWLRWDVGWYVELLNVTVDPDPVPKESYLSITVWYKVISQIPRWVVFTFTILDDLLDPIGEFVTDRFEVTPGVWCNPAEDYITVQIYIPDWAHVGPRARVYVNVFSDLPMNCGVPYSPEASTGFSIAKAG